MAQLTITYEGRVHLGLSPWQPAGAEACTAFPATVPAAQQPAALLLLELM